MRLQRAEQAIWEDAGASFAVEAVGQSDVSAAAAFDDLLRRSVEGNSAVASLLGVDRLRVSQWIRDRSLYAFSRADTRYFPRWQFADGGTLPGLREVVGALDAGLHPLVVDHWFTTPSVDLEIGEAAVSPVTWLGTNGDPRLLDELAVDL